MKSLSEISASQFMSSNTKQLVSSGLPILGTGLLVISVSGGFPPATWVLLFKTISQLNVLLHYQGPEVVIGMLIVLIIQSFLLAVAWGLLGWVIMREGTYIMTIQSKAELDRLLAFQSASGEVITPARTAMLTQQLPIDQDLGAKTTLLGEDQDFGITTGLLGEEQDFSVTTDLLGEEQDFSVTTDLLGEDQDFGVTTGPLKRGRDFDVTTGPLGVATASLEEEPQEEISWASRGVRLPDVRSHSVQSRSVQPSRVQSHSIQPRRTTSLRRSLSTGRLREEDLLENPFDKEPPPNSEPTFDVKRDRVKMVVEEELDEEEQENEEEDNPFVFGNPFDGPLPEVFRYDTELRRSVMELTEEEESKSNSSKGKGNGNQKTRRFSEEENYGSNGSTSRGSSSQKTRRFSEEEDYGSNDSTSRGSSSQKTRRFSEEEDYSSNGAKGRGSSSQKTRRFSEEEDYSSNGSKGKGSGIQKTRRL